MIRQIQRSLQQSYPRQFWLLVIGMLLSTIGSSMIWPFLTIYVSETLDAALSQVTILMTLNSIVSLISSFIAGAIIDKVGRKWCMVVSLCGLSIYYVLMSQANSWFAFAGLMSLSGFVNPLYNIGADAMIADMIPSEKRADAYSLTRMAHNVGIALGPSIGGFLANISYAICFYIAFAGLLLFGIALAAFAKETIPQKANTLQPNMDPAAVKSSGGYMKVLRDGTFMTFVSGLVMVYVCVSMIWVLLAAYAKTNYGISEDLYGFLPTTNALMVIFIQLGITQLSKRFPPLKVITVGALLYAIAVTSVSLATGFWGFWVCMVIMTLGELMLVPTATTYASNRAPEDMRGRYMSVYGFGWSAAYGIGPLLGGVLNDYIGPKFIWYGGGLAGFIAVAIFVSLIIYFSRQKKTEQQLSKVPA